EVSPRSRHARSRRPATGHADLRLAGRVARAVAGAGAGAAWRARRAIHAAAVGRRLIGVARSVLAMRRGRREVCLSLSLIVAEVEPGAGGRERADGVVPIVGSATTEHEHSAGEEKE